MNVQAVCFILFAAVLSLFFIGYFHFNPLRNYESVKTYLEHWSDDTSLPDLLLIDKNGDINIITVIDNECIYVHCLNNKKFATRIPWDQFLSFFPQYKRIMPKSFLEYNDTESN